MEIGPTAQFPASPFSKIARGCHEELGIKMGEWVKAAQSCSTLCDPHRQYSPWNSLGQNTGMGSLSLLQGIFPTQG